MSPEYANLWEGLEKQKMYYHTGKITATGPNSLRGIMKALGHDHIDLFKMDIEGSEYEAMNEAMNGEDQTPLNIGQMIVEIHEYNRFKASWRTYAMSDLEHDQFHSDINSYDPWTCRELSFINVTSRT